MPANRTKDSHNKKTFDPAAKIEQGSFNESMSGSGPSMGTNLNITTADTGDAAGPVSAGKKGDGVTGNQEAYIKMLADDHSLTAGGKSNSSKMKY